MPIIDVVPARSPGQLSAKPGNVGEIQLLSGNVWELSSSRGNVGEFDSVWTVLSQQTCTYTHSLTPDIIQDPLNSHFIHSASFHHVVILCLGLVSRLALCKLVCVRKTMYVCRTGSHHCTWPPRRVTLTWCKYADLCMYAEQVHTAARGLPGGSH